MELTLAQLYLGALALGLGIGRGVEADLQFHTEDMMGEANYAASRIAAGHAHATNAIADNNVLSVAAMAPRLAVEADNITMDANAAIACGNSATPGIAPAMAEICAQYAAGKPRALAKLLSIRSSQMSLWSSLEHLSGSMDKVAGAHGQGDVRAQLGALDPTARVSFDDPTMSRDTWTSRNAFTGCAMASKDALLSPMTGHAFPLLMPNLLNGLPQALVAGLPALCPSTGPGGGGMPSIPKMKLPELPEISDKADQKCGDSQGHMRDQMEYAKKSIAMSEGGDEPTLSSDVASSVKCTALQAGANGAPKRVDGGETSFIVKRGRTTYVCKFDKDECKEKALEQATADFLKKMGLPSLPTFGLLGGSTRAPGAMNPNISDDFRAMATVERPVDSRTAQLAENVRYVMSFGQVNSRSELRDDVSRKAIGQWYYPVVGQYGAVPPDQRGFKDAWRHALGSNGSL
jgi:hypothetical protein